jgi:propanol-preferring alcohol dehydrogenase
VTHKDIAEFLPIAAEIPLQPTVETYPLADANRAIIELRRGPVRGAKVLQVGPSATPASEAARQ